MKSDIKKWLRKENLIVLVLTGILLFIIALPTEDSAGKPKAVSGEQSAANGKLAGQQAADLSPGTISQEAGGTSDAEYAERLEQKLTDALTEMENVGRVKVMITLKSSEELVVEKEEPMNRSATNESDAQGGSRIVNQVETGETTVYRTDGSASEPYVVKTLTPQIEGVLVVAEGAGNGTVNRTVTEIVQALFGVEAHKVKVVKMESNLQ